MSHKNKLLFLFNQGNIGKDLLTTFEKEFTVFNADSDVEALKLLNSKSPHMIVLNVKTYEYGSVIIDMIKSNKKFFDIPIIVVSEELSRAIDWYNIGVVTCTSPNTNNLELLAKLNAVYNLYINYLKSKEENNILKATALIDEDTGLFNKKYLMARVVGEISRAVRQGESVSFVIIDIDDYSVLSDTYGEEAKEYVLKQVVGMVKQAVRLSDIVIRYAESQLGVFCPITDRVGVESFVEKLRNLIDRNVFQYNGIRIKTSVSIGAYTLGTSDFNSLEKKISNVFAYSEDALKRAKKNENKVEFFD